ncbi:hypothetical protein [Flagellimonas sp. S3867]|uniref:hypothetical protein n=1 Tax=Flagellimonas sp. S3867 TaxID=2768063 RepID=UPI001686DBC9|nr:hypothetical protein [Flagellimonas sp. S3867]
MTGKKKSFSSFIFIGGVLFCTFLMYLMSASETNNSFVNLILEKDSKIYVYSKRGSYLMNINIQREENPTVFPFIQVFEDNGELYVAPDKLKDIVDLLCGNFQVHDVPAKSSDGYVTSGSSPCFEKSFKNQSTGKIGEQIHVNMVRLTNSSLKEAFNIRWETNMKTNKSRVSENCHKKSFTVRTSTQPGEYVFSAEDFIMVNLQEVVDFYGNNVALSLNKEEQLLYIEHKE